MNQLTNRIFFSTSSFNPEQIKQSINMVVFLVSNEAEAAIVQSYIDAGYMIKQHPISDKSQIKYLVQRYAFVISSGDSILVISDVTSYQREFFVELMNSICGMSYGDGIDFFNKKAK